MKKNLQFRLIVILAVIVGCVVALLPSPGERINLGLDLKGGIHLVLGVRTEEAVEAEVNQTRDRMETDLREKKIPLRESRVTSSYQIELLGIPEDQRRAAEQYLEEYSGSWTINRRFSSGEVDFVVEMMPVARRSLQELTVRQARETIQKRVDQYGVAEPTITIYGSGSVKDQIIVELPGVDDPDRVINLIESTARLELKLVHPTLGGPFANEQAAIQAHGGRLPEDYEMVPYQDPTETAGQTMYMVVKKAASITGQHLKNARRSEDSLTGRSEVVFFLNSEGVRLFSRTTEQNVGNRLAIVLDGEVRSAPNISERINTDSARITGSFSAEQADDLALILRSGALPASIAILERRSVGPSLGLDSIWSGVTASVAGLALVVLAMLIIYRLSGVNAIICLVINVLILLAALAYFNATLTLPGIAGIILTIGMAVDANVLIFERIKEELRLGKTIRSALDAGFSRVFWTIMDTNLTTLIAALFLFQFGTGPIRGFAVTLAVGLVANIFAATFVSRTLFDSILQRRQVQRISI
ncbi:MAG: protein translocase subunit SecD [Acidobacteria bacterium]|nr:protein translocase subunit SecD [Acidobacteriota bacterium]